ncbi:MAG: M20/M25/M40 family metallo-hydrolase, partial [Chloroflexota bacterium]|nr:M20/M25/M40 family metallo-hydrolase [Chloroflexota bacterium]
MRTQAELTTLLADLVRIDSVNPDLIPGAHGEAALCAFIAAWAADAGLEAIVQSVAPGRPNVIVVARGSGGDANLMLNAHTDTVGVAGMDAPFTPRIEANKLFGRGAYDMKASLAASLLAAHRAKALHLRGDVIVTCVADEEVASKGTQAIIDELHRWRPAAVIVTEPTEMVLAVAHRGFAWFDIETFGVAAHGSRPHLGVDAIAKMGKVLVALEQHDHALRANPTHPYLGSGSVHASVIQGGQERSSYPAACTLQLERRTLPGETSNVVQAQLQAILDQCAHADAAFKARLHRGVVRDAFEAPESDPFVRLCQQQLADVTGHPATIGGVSFWADSALFGAAGVP